MVPNQNHNLHGVKLLYLWLGATHERFFLSWQTHKPPSTRTGSVVGSGAELLGPQFGANLGSEAELDKLWGGGEHSLQP